MVFPSLAGSDDCELRTIGTKLRGQKKYRSNVRKKFIENISQGPGRAQITRKLYLEKRFIKGLFMKECARCRKQ